MQPSLQSVASLLRQSLWGIVLAMAVACGSPQEKAQAPLFEHLGTHELKITTGSKMAQRFFTQGLNLTYGFNHAEAARSYREAIRLDSTCAMCYWGAAYVLGTNYNAAMDDAVKQEARQLTQKALAHAKGAADWEKALIRASAARYNYGKAREQAVLDQDYAQAMRKVAGLFPEHDDIVSLYAESLMNLHPWDLHTRQGEAKPWTPEILRTLEGVLARNPEHPGANHFYIHAVEASAEPERGLPMADRLIRLMPGAGHMVHMPSHIYIRTGHYHKGSLVNEKAAEVDSLYISACSTQGAYPLAYFPHNIHFLAATAAYEGRGAAAISAAYRVASHVDTTIMREPGWGTLQHYKVIPYYVLVKFGQWDRILALPKPAADLKYPLAVWHYARGMAYTGKNQLPAAGSELSALRSITRDTTLKNITIWDINSVDKLMAIASLTLEAGMLRKKGDRQAAIVRLGQAVALEDRLNYNEPPDWFFSVRHSLGACLLEDKQFARAEKVYREDLTYQPENGWALHGLLESLRGQNKPAEAKAVASRLREAWQYADITLVGSEVQAVAYQNLNPDSFPGSYLAKLPALPLCGPVKK